MPIIQRLTDVPHPAGYSHAVVATGKLAFVAGPALGDLGNPASTLIQAAALFRPDALVEVDAVVALPE